MGPSTLLFLKRIKLNLIIILTLPDVKAVELFTKDGDNLSLIYSISIPKINDELKHSRSLLDSLELLFQQQKLNEDDLDEPVPDDQRSFTTRREKRDLKKKQQKQIALQQQKRKQIMVERQKLEKSSVAVLTVQVVDGKQVRSRTLSSNKIYLSILQ